MSRRALELLGGKLFKIWWSGKTARTVTFTSRTVSGFASSSSTLPDMASFPKNSGRSFGFGERLFTSSVSHALSLPLPLSLPFVRLYRCWVRVCDFEVGRPAEHGRLVGGAEAGTSSLKKKGANGKSRLKRNAGLLRCSKEKPLLSMAQREYRRKGWYKSYYFVDDRRTGDCTSLTRRRNWQMELMREWFPVGD